jgi:acyl carrier protein
VSHDEILAQINEIIADLLDQPDLKVSPTTTAADVEGWDSFNHINIVLAVESRFSVKINTAEIEELHSVGDLVALVERKQKPRGGGT